MGPSLSIALALVLTAGGSDSLVVHEWGTFTSIVDPDGNSVRWHPTGGSDPLPDFVIGIGKYGFATVRMETPVVYFYTRERITATLRVDFPRGQITEWYPEAAFVGSAIEWRDLELVPGATALLPVETKASRYYAARATDSVPLSITTKDGVQREKFLFYRGIGDFALPLTAHPDGNAVRVTNVAAETVPTLIRFSNRDGTIAFDVHGALAAGDSLQVPRPALRHGLDDLRATLENALVSAGLYEREARAMLNTWDDTWFAPGERLIYLVPRSITDAAIPMTVAPEPTELVRVLVGRLELCDRERLKDVLTWPPAAVR
jgi:hypothetical protein